MFIPKFRSLSLFITSMALVLSACTARLPASPSPTPAPTYTFTPLPPTETSTPAPTPTPTFTATSEAGCTAKDGNWKGTLAGEIKGDILFIVSDCTISVISYGILGRFNAAKSSAPIAGDSFEANQSNTYFPDNVTITGAFDSPTSCKGHFQSGSISAEWEAYWESK